VFGFYLIWFASIVRLDRHGVFVDEGGGSVDEVNALFRPVVLVCAVEDVDPRVSLLDKGCEVHRDGFLAKVIAIVLARLDCFVDGGEVPGHLFRYASSPPSVGGYHVDRWHLTHPTLTHVPPDLPASMIHVFALYHPLARLAAPDPPLPPPTTIKSYCFGAGAMLNLAVEK